MSRAVLLVFAALALAFSLLLYATQREMIYFPRRYPRDAAARLPARWEAIAFEAAGARQFVYWAPGPAAGADSPVYFVFSGNATLALDWTDAVRQIQAGHPASSFALVEYPGYGQSGGHPGRRAIIATGLAAHGALLRRLGLDAAALGPRAHVIGHSLGAAAALELAVRVRPQSILLLAPFTSLLEMAQRVVGWPLCHLLRDRYDNRARLADIAAFHPRPRLRLHHGDADHVIPVEMSRTLARELSGWAEYQEHPGVAHNELIDSLPSLIEDVDAPSAAAGGSGIR